LGKDKVLTNLRIRNFKQFGDVDIELGPVTVLIGPNNSGKTTILQALALWYEGVLQALSSDITSPWSSGFSDAYGPRGVVLNRYNLFSIPTPNVNLLWHNGKIQNSHSVAIEITVNGVSEANTWDLHLKYLPSNEESFWCTPPLSDDKKALLPDEVTKYKIAFLPPMSGLTAVEPRVEKGRLDVLIGEGRTAEVLRNLCYEVYDKKTYWNTLVEHIRKLFGVEILNPKYLPSRGEIQMSYQDSNSIVLDLSSAGRGMLQTLLLLAYMYVNPETVLLLDEPDAHLEIIRQRQIYQLITKIARQQKSQLIIATHSEVILNAAGDRDVLIACVGKPHRIDDRSSKHRVAQALKNIGFDKYYQAELKKWVLFLEGETDLAILQAIADKLNHPAKDALDDPFLITASNHVGDASKTFRALQEAVPELKAYALFDNLRRELRNDFAGVGYIEMWARNEIENYIAYPEVLLGYAEFGLDGGDTDKRKSIMQTLIEDNVPPAALRDYSHVFWENTKISDDFLTPLFVKFFKKLKLPNLLNKSDFHILVDYLPENLIEHEVIKKLDKIVEVAESINL
jgi:ABC-type lipoprotein export system ATPase subunit